MPSAYMGKNSDFQHMDGQHKKVYKEMKNGNYTKVTKLLKNCKNRSFELLLSIACMLFSIKFLIILCDAGACMLIYPPCLYRKKHYPNDVDDTGNLPLLDKYEFEKGLGCITFFLSRGAKPVLEILISLWKYEKMKILYKIITSDQEARRLLFLHSIEHEDIDIAKYILNVSPIFSDPYPINYFFRYALRLHTNRIMTTDMDLKAGPVSKLIMHLEYSPFKDLIELSLQTNLIPKPLIDIVLGYYKIDDIL